MKTIAWTAGFIVVLAALGGGLWYWNENRSTTPQFRTVMVGRGELTQTVTASGQINPVLNVQVGSQISGIIQKMFVDFDSVVTVGQVLVQLDPATYQANVHQAEADQAMANAALELAQINSERTKELYAEKLVTRADFDKERANLHQAEAGLKVKDAALEKTKVDLARCTIHAPISGVVISRNVDVGQTVAASLSAPTLFVIANDLTKMQIDVNVSEADIGNVEVGQEVEFTVDAYPRRKFQAKVAHLRNAPIVVQNVVSYDTIIEVSNSDLKLKPGMTANVSILVARRDKALKIPSAALRVRMPEGWQPTRSGTNAPAADAAGAKSGSKRTKESSAGGKEGSGSGKSKRKSKYTVYVLPADNLDGVPQPVEIRTGISDGSFTEVLEGLNEGDPIVVAATGAQASSAKAVSPFGGATKKR